MPIDARTFSTPPPPTNSSPTQTLSSYRGRKARRIPWMMFTNLNPARRIGFWVNPSETQWRIATRTVVEPIPGGVVHHEWRTLGSFDTARQKFDLPVINISFQSGFVLPNAYVSGTNDPDYGQVPPGLGNFYDFLDLLGQPVADVTGTSNYVNIVYNSALFPHITLTGYFTPEGVQWTDSANDPGQIQTWGASFIVWKSSPTLLDGGRLSTTWRNILQQFDFQVMM